MHDTFARSTRRLLLLSTGLLLAACADRGTSSPLAPMTSASPSVAAMSDAAGAGDVDVDDAIRTLRRATAPYQNVNDALADGFVLLHDCEVRPEEGPVGAVYVNVSRLLDGVIDPSLPDALIYAPSDDGRLRLVGAEFAMPYAIWSDPNPPQFQGATFQREDEFGVFALHAWVWRQNPNGIFAETNPRVSCGS
ncbi:MAG: hypothetical protein ABI910_07800 [Gemmatimonadota bacterium]